MGSGDGMAVFVLEIEALGKTLQSFPGWWQVASKPLVCAGVICVSCRTGCACACRRGVPLVGRHRGQLMGEEGQEGKVLCFPSVCLVLEAGGTVPGVVQMHSQAMGGEWEMGMFLHVLRYLAAGSTVCCQTRSLATIERFDESVLKNLYCWYRKYFSVQSWRDLLKISVLFRRICCHVNRPSDLRLQYSDVHTFIVHFPLLHSASSCRMEKSHTRTV